MKLNNLSRLIFALFALMFLSLLPSVATAEVIDDITVRTDANGEVDMVLKFAFQIQYLRHFPEGKTPYSAIYFNVLGSVPPDQWQNYESRRTPPSEIIQNVTVSTKDKATGPTVQIKLFKPAEISVDLGKNGQSLIVHIKPDAAAALVPGAEALATPPSGEITAPKVVLPPVTLKAVHIPYGGKDGLPVYPDIDQPVAQPPIAESATLTLSEQIIKANNQAAPLMIEGGNALLAGQAFAAVESFNNVLKLPPNKYTEDAQLWIGIAKEKTGQLPRAILEYNSFLKLYPNGRWAKWVKDRLALLKTSQPKLFVVAPPVVITLPKIKNTEFQFSEFGSLSMEAYLGTNKTNTSALTGTVQVPTSISSMTQKSIITNVNVTARSYNNEYDNRLVLQEFYSANYLPGQTNSSRLGSAFYELKDRIDSYSVKIGRQSGMGGGVMGRFDGVTAGYGINPEYRANVVAGQLSDSSRDVQPIFMGASLDFGLKNPFGGSVYYIDQTVSGFTDRRAVGGNLRYFEPAFNVMSMFDYDIQFKKLNMMTVQGTLNGGGKSNDYNFLVDRRRSPILDLRNAINGTTATLNSLLQNGWDTDGLILLADQRTTVTNSASAGMVIHLNEKWNAGTDVSYSITEALGASGTDPALIGGGTSIEGFVPASPSSGALWSFSQRLTGMGVFSPRDVTNFGVTYSKSQTSSSESLQFSNHSDAGEKWSLDTSLTLGFQKDNAGGKSSNISPSERISYRLKNNLTLDTQIGLSWSKTSSEALQSSSNSFQNFLSFGFRFDF
jgi:hypothetical protein